MDRPRQGRGPWLGRFNTVVASYEAWRLPILERHGLRLMVDLLDERYHVYHDPAAAQVLAESLRGDDRVWGYHLYSDGGARVSGRDRDVKNVHRWDPTHPTFVGFRRTVGSSLNDLTEPDVVGFHDYHWVRDRSVHFADMLRFGAFARDHDAAPYRWVWVQNGRAGIGNPNRSRYTVTTSMALGLRGVLWFIGQQMMNTSRWEWNQFGVDRPPRRPSPPLAPLTRARPCGCRWRGCGADAAATPLATRGARASGCTWSTSCPPWGYSPVPTTRSGTTRATSTTSDHRAGAAPRS